MFVPRLRRFLTEALKPKVRAHRTQQLKERLKAGPRWWLETASNGLHRYSILLDGRLGHTGRTGLRRDDDR